MAERQEQELIAAKISSMESSAKSTLPTDDVAMAAQWVCKYAFIDSLPTETVPRLSQLACIANLIHQRPNLAQSLFSRDDFIVEFIKQSRELYDMAWAVELHLKHTKNEVLERGSVVDALEGRFNHFMRAAGDGEEEFYLQGLSLFIDMKQAYPKQTPPSIASVIFTRQRLQSAKVYQHVIKVLFERKNLKEHYYKMSRMVSWLIVMSAPGPKLHFDLAKKLNSFVLYHKDENSIEMMALTSRLFDLLSVRLPPDTHLVHTHLAALLRHLPPNVLRPFYQMWLQAKIKFLETLDFETQLRVLVSLGASSIVLMVLDVLWVYLKGQDKLSVLLRVFGGFVRQEYLSLSLSNSEEMTLYFSLIKRFMIGFANFQRFEGEQMQELTRNICKHALEKGLPLQNHYRSILQIYTTYQHRFTHLSESNNLFLLQVQQLNKGKLQVADVHALCEKYAIRDMGYGSESWDAAAWDVGPSWGSGGKVSNRYRGLQNMGNTCYFNSFVQALFMTKKFRSLIQAVANRPSTPSDHFRTFSLFNLFDELARKELGQLQPFRPDFFRSQLSEPFRSCFEQQDAAEFGRIYLQQLSDEMAKSDKERVSKLLFQHFHKELVCKACGKQKRKEEEIFDLILHPDSTKATVHLSTLLKNHFKPQLMSKDNQIECSKCSKKTDHISTLVPSSLSDILVFTVSLFEFIGKGVKILKPHSFQFSLSLGVLLNRQELGEYQLYAFIVHLGNIPNAGHYICWARNLEENPMLWYCLDDGYVTGREVATPDQFGFATNETPYMLFYSRRSTAALHSPLRRHKRSEMGLNE